MVYYLVNPRFQEASSACQSESGDLELVKEGGDGVLSLWLGEDIENVPGILPYSTYTYRDKG